MSLLGKKTIMVPSGVDIVILDGQVSLKKGVYSFLFPVPDGINVVCVDGILSVNRVSDAKEYKALHGFFRMQLANAVTGLVSGYEKKLEIVGVGYRVNKKDDDLEFSLGFSHPVIFKKVDGIEFELEGQTKITVKGKDKALVGQVAHNIRSLRPPEPYKLKGVRYSPFDKKMRKKAGKSGKSGK